MYRLIQVRLGFKFDLEVVMLPIGVQNLGVHIRIRFVMSSILLLILTLCIEAIYWILNDVNFTTLFFLHLSLDQKHGEIHQNDCIHSLIEFCSDVINRVALTAYCEIFDSLQCLAIQYFEYLEWTQIKS